MRAAVLDAPGPPENLRLEEWPDPVAGAGEAVVRVRAAGVCGHDVLARTGNIRRTFPAILGHELAGEVESVGPSVNNIAVGDRVVLTAFGHCGRCEACAGGHENRCSDGRAYGDAVPGGYAERCVVVASDLEPIPSTVSYEGATTACCAVATAVHALEQLDVRAGEKVLVTGAGGGVGVHALQLLRHHGAVPIAATSSPGKARALEQWADIVVELDGMNVRDALRRDGIRIDKAMDLTAGLTLPSVLASLPPGGRVCVPGNVRPDPVPVRPGLLIVRELEIVGSVGSRRRDLQESLSLLASGAITAVVGATFALDDAAQAHTAMESNAVVGRVMLTP